MIWAIGCGLVVGLNGVTDQVPVGYSLAVGGRILAEEILVKQVSEWADYVFQPDYPLTPFQTYEITLPHINICRMYQARQRWRKTA